MKNIDYYLKETFTLFKIGKIGNILSIVSISLILMILGLAMGSIFLGNNWIEILKREADIAVFSKEGKEDLLLNDLKAIKEIDDIKAVSKEEAKEEMGNILGDEITAVEILEDNPFLPYFRLSLELKNREKVLREIKDNPYIDHIRDNQDAADKLSEIIRMMKVVGGGIIFTVGLVSIIVISHIIKQDLNLHIKERETLRLLGAGEGFLNIPYILKALILTISSGVFSSLFVFFIIRLFYKYVGVGILPLPHGNELLANTILFILMMSLIFGALGGGIALSSKDNL